MKTHASIFFVLIAVLLAPLPSYAEDRAATIQRIEQYLSGVRTIVADFNQLGADGSAASGTFYLQRPGKMRWQYEPPTPVLMVADGTAITYYDYELDQVSQMPLNSTLAGFFAKDDVKFDDAVNITEFSNEASVIRLTIVEREAPEDGSLTLEFSDKPLALRNMLLTDASGQTTRVQLQNARYNVKLDKSLFVFTKERKRVRR